MRKLTSMVLKCLDQTDHPIKKNGGIIMYIRDDFSTQTSCITFGSINLVEYIVLYLKKLNIIIITIYRSPETDISSFKTVIENIETEMISFDQNRPSIILNGDFNFSDIIWEDGEIASSSRKSSYISILKKFADNYNLNQKINEPTRHLNILDLLFSNNHEFFQNISIEDYIKLSDHRIIVAFTQLQSTISQPLSIPTGTGFRSINFYDESVDWEKLNKELSDVSWDNALLSVNIDEMYRIFCSILL